MLCCTKRTFYGKEQKILHFLPCGTSFYGAPVHPNLLDLSLVRDFIIFLCNVPGMPDETVLTRVVNIAVLVSLPIPSAILLEYWHDYRRYFLSIVLKWVSAILFQLFFWQYSIPILLSASSGCCTTTPEAQHRGCLPARRKTS